MNKPGLVVVLVANLALFWVGMKTGTLFAPVSIDALKSIREAVPSAAGLVFVGILSAQLSSDAKARLVFLRWQNPMPGSKAFTHYVHQDDRIDVDALQRRFGPLPVDPKAQNRLWFKLYKSVEDQQAVRQAHREFLFGRDYACLAAMMLVVLGSAALYQFESSETALAYCGLLVAQVLLPWRAARVRGRRLVTTVLAAKSAESE